MHDINFLTNTVRALASHTFGSTGIFRIPPIANQIAYLTTQMTLKMLWSDEAKIVLGSTMFYPLMTMTALFLAARVAPAKVVHKCACYCTRKMRAVWAKVQNLLKVADTQKALLAVKRNHLITSAKVLVGAAEILIF